MMDTDKMDALYREDPPKKFNLDEHRAPTKVREGDQALPVQNDEVDCQTRLINRINSEIPKRREVGIQRYGTALQPFNGRSSTRDLWEELADASTYFMQVEAEYDALVEALTDVITAPGDDDLDEACARGVRLLKSIGREIPNDPFIP